MLIKNSFTDFEDLGRQDRSMDYSFYLMDFFNFHNFCV